MCLHRSVEEQELVVRELEQLARTVDRRQQRLAAAVQQLNDDVPLPPPQPPPDTADSRRAAFVHTTAAAAGRGKLALFEDAYKQLQRIGKAAAQALTRLGTGATAEAEDEVFEAVVTAAIATTGLGEGDGSDVEEE